MKHSLLLFALTLGCLGTAQAQQPNGHFSMRYPQGMVQSDLDAFCRTQLPNLCEGTTFEVTNDRIDAQGLRDVTLQQYVGGMRANGKVVKLCLQAGKVLTFSGNVMTRSQMASAPAQTRAIRSAGEIMQVAGLSAEMAGKAELVWETFDGQVRQAYRLVAGAMCIFIDAQTGEVLSKHSTIKYEDQPVKGTPVKLKGTSMYNGELEFDGALLDDGSYSLFDYGRKLYTFDASYDKIFANGYDLNSVLLVLMNRMTGEMNRDNDELLKEIVAFLRSESNKMYSSTVPFRFDAPVWANTTVESYMDSLALVVTTDRDVRTYSGKKITAQIVCPDGTKINTDTVKMESKSVFLHLPETYKYADDDVLQVTFGAINDLTHRAGNFKKVMACQSGALKVETDDSGALYVFFNNANYINPLVDIQWGMQRVMDYYRDTFGYNSFDGKGTEVHCYVNPPEPFCPAYNACAVPDNKEGAPGVMMFGLGDNTLKPFVALQIIGHEFTHLVARNLDYDKPDGPDLQPSALNESFADIVGMAVDRYATGNESWELGCSVNRQGTYIRCFDRPETNKVPSPSSYLDKNFDTEDYEEHTNSFVQSHMFYLLCTGGEGVNSLGQSYAVTPMDRTEAEHLAFRTLERHTFVTMNYQDAAAAWINAAMIEFGEGSPQQKSVIQAWAAVGLGDGDTAIEKIGEQLTRPATMRYNLMGQPQREAAGLMVEDGRVTFVK